MGTTGIDDKVELDDEECQLAEGLPSLLKVLKRVPQSVVRGFLFLTYIILYLVRMFPMLLRHRFCRLGGIPVIAV